MSVQTTNGSKPAGGGKTSAKNSDAVSSYAHPKPDVKKLREELHARRRKDIADSAWANERTVSELVAALYVCRDVTDEEARDWISLAGQAIYALQRDLNNLTHVINEQAGADEVPF